MESKQMNTKPLLKHFRMICARTNAVHMFKAFTVTDARCQARVFFNGPVNNGGVVLND